MNPVVLKSPFDTVRKKWKVIGNVKIVNVK